MRLRSTAIPLTAIALVGALAIVAQWPRAVAQTGDERAVSREAATPAATDVRAISYDGVEDGHLSTRMIDACLEVAQQIDPSLAIRLRSLCDGDPEAFEEVMQRRGRRLIGLARLREQDPDLYSAKILELHSEVQVNDTVQRLLEAREAGKDTTHLESQLRGLLRIQVALSIKARGDYIRRMEEHLEALRLQLEDQVERFDEIVDERLSLLVIPGRAPGHPLLEAVPE